MKSISKIVIAIAVLLSSINGFAQIKNIKTETVKIYGNCSMCKASIEKAGNLKKVANVEWNENTKMATLTYDSKKTNQDEILKRIALAGYDSEKFRAPRDVYAKMSSCRQSDMSLKTDVKNKQSEMEMNSEHNNQNHSCCQSDISLKTDVKNKQSKMDLRHSNQKHSQMAMLVNKDVSQNQAYLKPVFDSYFSVKDALIKADAGTASTKASELLVSIKAVDMNKLSVEERTVWVKITKDLIANAENISKFKDVAKQRNTFMKLSANIYALAKISKQDSPVYYQYCPMYNGGKGANWLSKEDAVKNPYYGSQMLSCGSTVETIK